MPATNQSSTTAQKTSPSSAPLMTIQAGSPAYWNLKELWADREILRTMVWRDVAVRYKETVVGFLWVVIQPFLMMVILSVFFRHLGGSTSPAVPIHVRIFSSLLIWDFISMSFERASISLLQNAMIISKLYFCRLILPLTPVGACGFDFLVKLALLSLLMAVHGVAPTVYAIFIPLILGCTLLFTVSICIWLSALTAFYKDIALTVPFVLRILFFMSPIFYEASQVFSSNSQFFYHLNPIAALIESFNFVLLGTDTFPVFGLLTTVVGSVILFVTGTSFFRHVETSIVDVI